MGGEINGAMKSREVQAEEMRGGSKHRHVGENNKLSPRKNMAKYVKNQLTNSLYKGFGFRSNP